MAATIFSPAPRLRGAAARLSTLMAMARKHLVITSRYPVEFVASFGQVFAIVAIFTLAGLTFADTGGALGDTSTAGVVIYGFILFLFLSDTLWSIGYNIRAEQKQGTLEQLYLSPASKFASLISRVTNVLLWTSLLSVAGVWLMAAMLGRLPFDNPGLGLYLLTMSLAGTFGIGFAFAGVTLRIKEAGQTLANGLQFLLLIFCAIFFPFSSLPDGLLVVSRAIPLAYAVDAFRSAMMGFPPGFPELASFQTELAITTVFGLAMPALGYLIYRGAEMRARRTGSLAEY